MTAPSPNATLLREIDMAWLDLCARNLGRPCAHTVRECFEEGYRAALRTTPAAPEAISVEAVARQIGRDTVADEARQNNCRPEFVERILTGHEGDMGRVALATKAARRALLASARTVPAQQEIKRLRDTNAQLVAALEKASDEIIRLDQENNR